MIVLLEIEDVLKIKDDNFSFLALKECVDVRQDGFNLVSVKPVDHTKRSWTIFCLSFLWGKFCKPDVEITDSKFELLTAIGTLAFGPPVNDGLCGTSEDFADTSHPIWLICTW